MSLYQQIIYRANSEQVLIGPTNRFAMTGAYEVRGFGGDHDNSKVSALISNEYYSLVMKNRSKIQWVDWTLDSGAFTAHSKGVALCNTEYTETVNRLMSADPELTEAFGLDVIGDPAASIKNVKNSWRGGVAVMPTFHYGSDFDYLLSMAKEYPKIALGGCARMPKSKKIKWVKACFTRLWTAGLQTKVHGLGFGSDFLTMMPFHSVDASSWNFRPMAFGSWRSFDKTVNPKTGQRTNLRREINIALADQRKARQLNRGIMLKIHAAVCKRFDVKNELEDLK